MGSVMNENTFPLRMSLCMHIFVETTGIGGRARVELRSGSRIARNARTAHAGNAHALPSVAVLLQRRMPG